MGVGADIAAGSQAEKGMRALFVLQEKKKIARNKKVTLEKFSVSKRGLNSQVLKKKNSTIKQIKPASPSRFVEIVINPELKEELLE